MATAPPERSALRRGVALVGTLVRLHPRPFAVAVAGAAVYGATTVAQSFATGVVVDRVVLPRFERGDVEVAAVVGALALIVTIGVVRAGGIVVRRRNAGLAQARIAATLRERLVQRYAAQPLSWHQARPTGELLAHLDSDTNASTEVLAPLPYATGVVVLLAVAATALLVTDVPLGLVALALMPVLAWVNVVYQHRVDAPVALAQEHVGRVATLAHESFEGILVVKAMGAAGREVERFSRQAAALRDAKLRASLMRAGFTAVLDAVPALAAVVLVAVGAWRVDSGGLSAGQLVSVVSLFSLLVWPLRLIGYVLGDLPRSLAGYARVSQAMAGPVPAPCPPAPGAVRSPEAAVVTVEGLTYAFPGDERTVLAGVDLAVAPGRLTAVCGPTGSGKSTLLEAVAGLLDPLAGRAAVDGYDVRSLQGPERGSVVALVAQEAFLFAASLRENILLGLDAPDRDVARALVVAQADELVAALPGGLDTVVGERGVTLSGGQRQRIALARALVRRPRVLLLDDATSAVDPTTEARILAALAQDLPATTVVMVANRPSSMALADDVVYLEGGRVLGHGTHAELQASVPGYLRLVEAYEADRVGQRP